jgi:uncharacterized protein YjaZ
MGGYIRLSREDLQKINRGLDDSNSVKNQRDILNDFHFNHAEEFESYTEYVDDGHTGTDTERESFQRLLGDVMSGKINCVVVKDLSRFARNYSDAGSLIDNLFVQMGIRFISLAEGVDSYLNPDSVNSIIVPITYDVIMASDMLGHIAPTKVDETQKHNIDLISNDTLWKECELSIKRSLNCFAEHGIELPVKEYMFTILLANCESPYIILNEGYCGDGGIPGYIFSWLIPNEYTLEHLPVALAHETNHNVRFQFVKWKNDITLGEMMISEGLAENFATFLYGEHKAGPWVTKTDIKTLNEYIKPIIREGLNIQGLENLNAYLYGDEMAALQNYPQVGLPYCAGYACGYHLVKHYLKKTGKHIVEATLLSAKEILDATEEFWNE